MRTVVIIGAGGAVAQAGFLRPHWRNKHPPLDGNFFQRCSEVARSAPEVQSGVTALKDALRSSDLFYDPWAYPSPPMEQFFADVYYEVASSNSAEAFSVFVELLRLYSVMLGFTTNWMTCRNRPGLLGQYLRSELENIGHDELTVITFNQDLVIENELASLPTRYGHFALIDLYGADGLFNAPVAPDLITDHERFPYRRHKALSPMPVRLYKLHGSLNWVFKIRSLNPRPGTLFPRHTDNRLVYVTDSRRVLDHLALRTGSLQGRSAWYAWPLVVPPIYDKQRIIGMDLLRGIWESARERLETAERLVLIGYSLPEADIQARQMLRRAFTRNSNLETIDCVNPDVSLAAKLKVTLGPKVVRMYEDLESYVTYGLERTPERPAAQLSLVDAG